MPSPVEGRQLHDPLAEILNRDAGGPGLAALRSGVLARGYSYKPRVNPQPSQGSWLFR